MFAVNVPIVAAFIVAIMVAGTGSAAATTMTCADAITREAGLCVQQKGLSAAAECRRLAEATVSCGPAKAGPAPAGCESEVKIAIDWVLLLDRGAQARYAQFRSEGKSAFEAVVGAQAHNPPVQRMLQQCRGVAEAYLLNRGFAAGGQAAPPQRESGLGSRPLSVQDCRCISVLPTATAGYRVVNSCDMMEVAVNFSDASLSHASHSMWGTAVRVGQGKEGMVYPGSQRVPSIRAFYIRNSAHTFTCQTQ